MKIAPLSLTSSESDALLSSVKQSLLERRQLAASQISRGRLMTFAATFLALTIPLLTWIVSLQSASSPKENNIGIFAFSSVPLSGIFVLIVITMLRRRRALEDQIERLDDRVTDLHKLRVLAKIRSVEEINIFREIALARALAGAGSLLSLGKEEDEVQSSLNIYGSLVRIVADSRPKK